MTNKELAVYVGNQLENIFPDSHIISKKDIHFFVEKAMKRVNFCFSNIKMKYYINNEGSVLFSHLHSDQYATFLYFLSNEAYNNSNNILYEKASYLNKLLNGIDLYGHVQMPEIFILSHPIGTIIGRAKINNYTVIYQNVTIGGKTNNDGSIDYPSFGKKVAFLSNTSVIGKVKCSNNVIFAANTKVIGGKFDNNSLITGRFPNINIKKSNNDFFTSIFKF